MRTTTTTTTYGWGVLMPCMAVVIRPWTLASLQRRDGARRVFHRPRKALIACTKARSAVRLLGEFARRARLGGAAHRGMLVRRSDYWYWKEGLYVAWGVDRPLLSMACVGSIPSKINLCLCVKKGSKVLDLKRGPWRGQRTGHQSLLPSRRGSMSSEAYLLLVTWYIEG